MKKFTALLLTVVMILLAATPVLAASGAKTDPYGFTWLDETTDIWYFQYYVYDEDEEAYTIEDYAYLDGNKLYDKKGDLILSTVYAMDDVQKVANQPTVAFYDGELYFITKTGEVCHMEDSTDSKYSKNTSVSSAKYFTLDADGIGTKVSSKKLSSLTFSGSYSRNSNSSGSTSFDEDGYVKQYAYQGDPEKVAYDAYYDDELLLSVYCKGSNVWLETESKLLSDSCVGAKFVGYSDEYSIILYDTDGSIYYFLYNQYNRAYTISLGEEIMYFTKDTNGFIDSITTNKKTYELDDIIDEDEYYEDLLDISYVENSTNKSIAYQDKSTIVATLEKKSYYLYWEDERLSNSYKPSYFGISEEGYPVWINNSGDLYYYNGNKSVLIEEDVTRVRYDDDGFVYKYVIGSSQYELDI